MTDDIDVAIAVGAVLERLSVPHFLGGSMASSQGVLRVCKDTLDNSYMDDWAARLGIADLLARARAESG